MLGRNAADDGARNPLQEWLKFLRLIDVATPVDLQIHLIADNYAPHKHGKVQRWLKRHPRFHVHFTPTSLFRDSLKPDTLRSMRKFVISLAVLAMTIPASAQLATKKSLTLAAAKTIAAAAEAEARKNNWNVVISIVDDGANLLYLERMDGTQIGSVDIAPMKARTAIRMKRPTKVLEDAVLGGRNTMLKLPDVLPVEGGIPLTIDGVMIGAIGISGVTSAQDGQIAAAGAKALEGMK